MVACPFGLCRSPVPLVLGEKPLVPHSLAMDCPRLDRWPYDGRLLRECDYASVPLPRIARGLWSGPALRSHPRQRLPGPQQHSFRRRSFACLLAHSDHEKNHLRFVFRLWLYRALVLEFTSPSEGFFFLRARVVLLDARRPYRTRWTHLLYQARPGFRPVLACGFRGVSLCDRLLSRLERHRLIRQSVLYLFDPALRLRFS